jgi:hypothetical protein
MTKNRSFLATGIIALLVASSPALASASRTFVSGVGTDTGACTTTEPCRTFAYALTQTAPSGEIIVLSSAGYGAVTINKAVSIINTSNFAGVTVTSGDGITINAGTNDSVVIRGITVDGGGTGSSGITFNSGGKLTIDQCNLQNLTNGGIYLPPTSGNSNIIITNTTATNNYAGVYYLTQDSNSGTIAITIDRLSANNNGVGVLVNNNGGTVSLDISNSVASGNSSAGYYFIRASASLDTSYASANGVGVYATLATTLALGRSVLMNNTGYGLQFSGSTVNSYKDNRIAGNGSGQVNAIPTAATFY